MEIFHEIEEIKNSYNEDEAEIIDGLEFSIKDTIKRIEYYSNSMYLDGQKDRRGRRKPFYNIINARVNVATRATDFDTKDITLVSDNPKDYVKSMLLSKELQKWFKKVNFAKTLNEMGYTRAKYGGLLVKKVKKDGELYIEIPAWKNIICDNTDITSNPIIELHWLKPHQLAEKRGVWDTEIINKIIEESDEGSIEILELTGYFPEEYFDENGSETDFKLYHCFVYMKEKDNQKILFQEELKENTYKYIPYLPANGRGLGIGIVEDGFEAQMWTNDAIIREKDVMELGSKLIMKTTDPNIANNVLTDLDNGDIVKLGEGRDISVMNTVTNALPEFQNLIEKWDKQYERVTSTFNAVTGEQMPSGTPFRQTALLNQEATSMFDYRREEMGIFLTELFNDWILPHLSKQISRQHILAEDFSPEELKYIDEAFSTYTANRAVIKKVLEGKVTNKEEYEKAVDAVNMIVSQTGKKRFIDVPDDYFKDFKTQISIMTTNEMKNKAVLLESLNTILTTVAQAPQILQDETMSSIFGRILELANVGISPTQIGIGAKKSQQMQAQQAQQEQPQQAQQPMAQLTA